MSTASKHQISKRHIKRIIENETNIDLAGSSQNHTQIIQHSLTTNRSYKDNCLDLYKINDIHAFNININETLNDEIEISENGNHIQCQNDNNMRTEYDHDGDIDNPTTEIKNRAYNDADDDNKFKNDIAIWALSYNINHNACNALITILRKYYIYHAISQRYTNITTNSTTKSYYKCMWRRFFLFGFA